MRVISLILLLLSGCGDGGMTTPPQPALQPAPQQPAPQPVSQPPAPAVTPTANAGPDQIVKAGDRVTLKGTISPADAPVCWQIVSIPEHSQMILREDEGDQLTARFTADLPGEYIIKLGCTEPTDPFDTVKITAEETLLTMQFSATMGNTGKVEGTFSYVPTQGPSATNLRKLHPNVGYILRSWQFVVEPGDVTLVPPTEYSSSKSTDTAEFCQGICVFASGNTVTLILTNESEYVLRLYFNTIDPTLDTSPPASRAEWGSALEATYQHAEPVGVPLVILKNVTLEAVN